MTELTPETIAAFMVNVHEGWGDQIAMENTHVADNFWASKMLDPPVPAPASGEAYRASNRDRGLPAMSEAWVAANNGNSRGPIHRPGLYDATPPKQLSDYAGQPVVSLALPKQGESDQDYVKRFDAMIRPNLGAEDLAPEIVEAATAAYNQARERLDNGTAREDTRKSGDGVGITGEAPTVRGMEGAASYRDLAANAAQSAHAVMAAARQAEEAQRIASAVLSRSGYEPVAGEAAATVRQTTRQYAGNQGMFR